MKYKKSSQNFWHIYGHTNATLVAQNKFQTCYYPLAHLLLFIFSETNVFRYKLEHRAVKFINKNDISHFSKNW